MTSEQVRAGAEPDADGDRTLAGLSHRVDERFFDNESPHLDRFGWVLVLTVVAIVVLSLLDLNEIDNDVARGIASTVLSATIGVTLVLALRAAGVARRWRRFADIVFVMAVVTSVVAILIERFTDTELNSWETDRPSPLWVLIAVAAPIAIVRRLVAHRFVSASTMAGAVAAYLLIAVAFCYTYLYLDGEKSGRFFGQTDVVDSTDFMYFSLVTLTTVGYGDLSPVDALPRLLATAEAVLGQVYLVTFVAMMVGLLIQQRDS